jgi:predicted nucleotidyltransferase
MTRNQIKKIVAEHRAQFFNLGVKSLAVFGSTVRGEATPESDIDILVEFTGPATFDGYMATKFLLEDLLECPVDLVTPQALKPGMRSHIEQEAIYVT